jgi:hypothetical protein
MNKQEYLMKIVQLFNEDPNHIELSVLERGGLAKIKVMEEEVGQAVEKINTMLKEVEELKLKAATLRAKSEGIREMLEVGAGFNDTPNT